MFAHRGVPTTLARAPNLRVVPIPDFRFGGVAAFVDDPSLGPTLKTHTSLILLARAPFWGPTFSI